MSTQPPVQGSISYQRVEILKDSTLGVGSYGAVYKARCDQLLCAAKVLHSMLFDRDAEQQIAPQRAHRLPIRRFERECQFLSAIRHPNIIQYLGIHHDPNTNLPVLLMELMDQSLTSFLENSQSPVAFHVQVNICHDVALALSFLHSNGIIHRDLSSNNVLMIGNIRAKVTDFGMAKMFSFDAQTLTKQPGAVVYMPPESLDDNVEYSYKLDCFAIGVLIIQVLTRLFPKPGGRLRKVDEGLYQKVPEHSRRKNHIDLIPKDHPLLPLALECIENEENNRPSIREIVERLSEVRQSSLYLHSVSANDVPSLAVDQLQLDELVRKNEQISDLESVLLEKDEQIRSISAHFQQRIEDLEGQLQQQFRVIDGTKTTIRNDSEVVITCKEGKRAPRALYRMSNAVMNGDTIFFISNTPHLIFYTYNWTTFEWSQLPDIANDLEWYISTIVMVNGHLTTIGGYDEDENLTNQLFSLVPDEETGYERWQEDLPPMLTKPDGSVAFSYACHLVVAGGLVEDSVFTNIVEVLNTNTLTWAAACSLPEPLATASVTVCNDNVFILGGWCSENTPTCSVLTCNIRDLIDSSTKSCTDETRDQIKRNIWYRIADLPVLKSTCITYQGHLLVVGGVNVMNKAVTAVYVYDRAANSWRVIGQMLVPRGQAYVTVLPSSEILVVGGHKGYYLNKLYEVELLTVNSNEI